MRKIGLVLKGYPTDFSEYTTRPTLWTCLFLFYFNDELKQGI